MLFAAFVALSCAAVAVSGRWVLHRVDSVGRTVTFPYLTVGLLVAGAAAAGVPVLRHAQLEARLGAVAEELTGRQGVHVRCENPTEAWIQAHPERGFVEFDGAGRPASTAVITYDTCTQLADWIASDHASPTLEQVIAVHVLTHEAMHLAGTADEAVAECRAVQRDRVTAERLGATPDQALDLARRYVTQVYPTMPEGYRSSQCRLGGDLDEHLDSSPWQ